MFPLVTALFLVVNKTTASSTNVINMCEDGSWRLGVVYISVTPTNMGSSTRCECTMSGHVQGQNITTTFVSEYFDPLTQNCADTVLIVRRPGASHNFTCVSSTTPYTLDSTENITLTLSRPSASSSTSLCLRIIPVNHTENDILLTCGSGAQTSTASPTSPEPTTTPSTSIPAMSCPPLLTSEVSTSAGNTLASSTAMAASTVEMTSSTEEMTSNAGPHLTGEDDKTDLIPPVMGGVVGGSALLIIIVVLIVVYTRKKRQNYPPREERPGVRCVSSEDVLIDNVLYESSSAHASNQPPQVSQPGPTNEKGVNQNVGSPSVADNKTSADEAMFSMGNAIAATSPAAATAAAPTAAAVSATAAARRPTSDVYAVVNKPGRRQKPTDS